MRLRANGILIVMITLGAYQSALAGRAIDGDLERAARNGDVEAVERLVEQGANPKDQATLFFAISSGQSAMVAFLLEHGADPNAWAYNQDYVPLGPEGSPVLAAAKLGNRAMLDALKRHGANFNVEVTSGTYVGETPLTEAASEGYIDAARLLIEYGSRANYQTQTGVTALFYALKYGAGGVPKLYDMMELLLSHGADPDVKTDGVSARELVYKRENNGAGHKARQIIDKYKPHEPFTAPDERDQIGSVLRCKGLFDALYDGYKQRTQSAYQRWRTPRAKVIAEIEADPQFQARQQENANTLARWLAPPLSEEDQELFDLSKQGCNLLLPLELRAYKANRR